MKTIRIPKEVIAAIPVEQFGQYAFASVGGSSDVYVYSAAEVRQMYLDDAENPVPNPTIVDLVNWQVEGGVSGNSMEMIGFIGDELVKIRWGEWVD
jgi:hypothetical protein